MSIILPALGAAFAAFCVWLGVRIFNRRERWAKWTAVGLIVLISYPGAYLALFERKLYMPTGVDPVTQQNFIEAIPSYRLGGESVKAFFGPAYRIDRVLRDDFWTTIEHSSGRKWKNPPRATLGESERQ